MTNTTRIEKFVFLVIKIKKHKVSLCFRTRSLERIYKNGLALYREGIKEPLLNFISM